MPAPAIDLTVVNVGGPCKIIDAGTVLYSTGNVRIEPQINQRPIPSAIFGEKDAISVDLTFKISFTPKPVWSAGYQGCLLPAALTNFTTSGARLIGAVNRNVTILGADGEQFLFTRAAITKLPDLFLGLGGDLYSGVEYTAFIGAGKQITDNDAFFVQSTGVTWDQSDYPAGHQESLCTAAWGAVAGWALVRSEEAFRLTHELKMTPIKSANITVDYRLETYRAMFGFKPQGPSSAQLLSSLALQGAGAGLGTRLSANAADFVVTGNGIAITGKSMALHRGQFEFDNKLNRHGEWGMITSMSAPGAALVLA